MLSLIANVLAIPLKNLIVYLSSIKTLHLAIYLFGILLYVLCSICHGQERTRRRRRVCVSICLSGIKEKEKELLHADFHLHHLFSVVAHTLCLSCCIVCFISLLLASHQWRGEAEPTVNDSCKHTTSCVHYGRGRN